MRVLYLKRAVFLVAINGINRNLHKKTQSFIVILLFRNWENLRFLGCEKLRNKSFKFISKQNNLEACGVYTAVIQTRTIMVVEPISQ